MTNSINSIEKLPNNDYGASITDINRGTLIATTNESSYDYYNADSKFEQDDDEDWSDIDEKKILRKIDWNLIPIISLLYLLCYLDRGNIGNAKIEGLQQDLKLTDNQYNICLTVFFITYSFFEVPSNILLKWLGKQSIYVPSMMLAWGIVMTLMGTVTNYTQLLVTRLLLGLAESALFPAISYCLTQYYCKREMQYRQALFYSAASLAGAFSGLLAFGIAKMNGIGGYEGWRWIFILEGLLTIIVAITSFFLLPNYPDTAKFLTQRERDFILWRLATDNHIEIIDDENISVEAADHMKIKRSIPNFRFFKDEDDVSIMKAFEKAIKDWQILLYLLLYYSTSTPTYACSLTLPSVVKGLGYTSSKAQLMTVPIYCSASIISIIQAIFSDKIGIRSWFIGGNLILVVIGFTMSIIGQELTHPTIIYAGCFIAVIGLYSAFPGVISWCANNLANSRKRAIGMAIQIGLGNFGGCFASNFYKTGSYTLGHSLALGFSMMGVVSCIILVISYKIINTKREMSLIRGKFDQTSDQDLFKMGDKSPYFRYRL